MIKSHFSERMGSSGISDVAFTSVHSDKTRLKKLMMRTIIIIIIKKSQEMTVFSGRQKLTSAETEARKAMVDFKFEQVCHHKRAFGSRVSSNVIWSLYWWVELCVPSLHRECYCTL